MPLQYCDSHFPITCVSKSILGILPSLALVLLGQWSLRDLTFETQNLQLPLATPVHSTKMLCELSLMVLPLGISIFENIVDQIKVNLIMYLASETENKEILTILVCGLTILNWLVSLGISRKEYKRLGYTSTYTRMFWFIAMMADLILSFILPIENKNKINKFGIISFISTTILVHLNIYGYLNKKDSPKAIIIDELKNEFDKLRVARTKNSNFFKGSYFQSLPKPDSGNEISQDGIMKKFLRINTKTKVGVNELPFKDDSGFGSINSYKKSLLDEIEQIGIPRIEEALRNEKQTPVYVILYVLNRQLITTRRSYAEFLQLYARTRESFPGQIIQNFPLKDSRNENSTRIQLEKFLNYLWERKLVTFHLYDFLKPEDEMPYFGSFTGRISRQTSYNPPDLRKSLHSPDSLNIKFESEGRKSNMSKASRKSLSFSQPFGTNDLTSFFRDSMRPSFDNNQIDLNHKLINNYNRFSVGGTEDKVYKINIVSAEIKEDDVYYHITVSCSGITRTVIKTYDDFVDLHETMVPFAELSEAEMQDLPDKGNFGFLTARDDPKLVDYRKFALKNYLQYIMFNTTLRYCPAVRNFLEINYSAINPNF